MKFLDKTGLTYFWGKIQTALNGKKNTQSSVSDPTASGTAVSFIDSITQNAQGVITPTKKTVQSASQSAAGLMSAADKTKLDGIAENAMKTGVNLLDNWYFVGGGSQQGGGRFPINQRGSVSYSGNEYTINRWLSTNTTVTVNNDYLTLTGNNQNFQQRTNTLLISSLLGKKFTASILKANGTFVTGTVTAPSALPSSEYYLQFTSTAEERLIWGISPNGRITFYIQGAATTPRNYIATKLEIGKVQTLAHQENGVWVLNDPPPNYDMELLKCQLSTADSSDTYANRKLIPITANMGTVTGTGSTVTVTKTVTGVTAAMTVDRIEFGTPGAVKSGWTVTTATRSVTFSAVINGSTTVKIKLSDNTDVTGT